MKFDWNPTKAAGNRRKHGVSFDEAATAILDPYAIIVRDEAHSENEDRRIAVGVSIRLRMLFVVHLEEEDEQTIRIISARKATAKEKRDYEENRTQLFGQ